MTKALRIPFLIAIFVSFLVFFSSPFLHAADSDFANTKCQEQNIEAVYLCLGNTVKVVSKLAGEGATFYKSNGAVVKCPDSLKSSQSAECSQMQVPNYCPSTPYCIPKASSGEVISGSASNQDDTAISESASKKSATPDSNVSSVAGANTSASDSKDFKKKESEVPILVVDELVTQSVPAKNNVDTSLSFIVPLLAVLGVVAIVVLFFMFKRSISE